MDSKSFEIDPNAYASAYIQTLKVDESKFEDFNHRQLFFNDEYIRAYDSMLNFVEGKKYDRQ